MGKFSYSWSLMSASFNVLKNDKRLIIFPLLSGICCLVVLASFTGGAFVSGHLHAPQNQTEQIIQWITLFGFYFANYFIITFFNVGVVAFAVSRMAGGEPTISGAFREAFNRIHLIAAWAFLAATVGIILRVIGERSGKLGKIITSILGSAWSILTFLVVPVLVMEDKGPIEAFKSSASLLKKTWGERIIGNFSFGLIFLLLTLPALAAIFFGILQLANHNTTIGFSLLILSVIYFITLSLVHSVLISIFQAALYLFTQGVKDETHGFPVILLKNAMTAK
jgi:Family of unknown function (DUF6159)